MPKKVKSNRQELLLGNLKVYKDDSVERLQSKEYVKEALVECLFTDDMETFKELLKLHLELTNISEFSKKAGIPRKTIYRMLEPDSNPTLKNITKLLTQLVA